MNPKAYRDKEVLKIIDSAFEQFKITNPNEKLDIANAIQQQLDTSNPVSTYYEDINASSAVYRSNVRNAMIDIISHLLALKDAKTELNQWEGVSRSVMEQANIKLLNLQKRLIGMNNKIKETFMEGIDSGKHSNTIVKEGKLRVDFLDKQVIPSKVKAVTFPANSHFDGVQSTFSNNEMKLFKTGLGSDSFRVTVSSNVQPGSYVMGNYLEGVTVQFTIDTEAFIPKAISGKASTPFRIALWEGYDATKQKWIVLGHDETIGNYSYIDTDLSNAFWPNQTFTQLRISAYFPDYIVKDSKYFYEGILHNIKIFKRDMLMRTEKGSFLSHKYTAPEGLFKIKFDARLHGWVCCKLILDDDFTNPYYILPKNSHLSYDKYYNINLPNNEEFVSNPTMDFKFIDYYNGQEEGIILPLAPKTNTSGGPDETVIRAWGENNTTFDYTISTSAEGVYSIKPTGYTGYVFVIYALHSNNNWAGSFDLRTTSDEFIFDSIKWKTDLHDKLNNFVFPLSSFPFRRDFGTLADLGDAEHFSQNPTFRLYQVGGTEHGVEIDATEIFPTNGTIEFTDNELQYYYFNKKLYTNFNLYDFGNDNVKVEYKITCDNIQLAIDLYDNATVDDYTLEFISTDKPIYFDGLQDEEQVYGSPGDEDGDSYGGGGAA